MTTYTTSPAADVARLAQQVGLLENQLRNLKAEYTGAGMKPQAGCCFATVIAGDTQIKVEYEYDPGEESQTSGPPERCYEGTPECVSIIQALVNGKWVDPADVFHDALIEKWQEQIAGNEHDAVAAARDEYECARWEQRQEQLMEES